MHAILNRAYCASVVFAHQLVFRQLPTLKSP